MKRNIDIDYYDHGYAWMRERDRTEKAETPVKLHAKIVRRAFHKYGKRAPRVLALWCIHKRHFTATSDINDFMPILSGEYGYSNTREGKRRILAILRSAPDFFHEPAPGFFTPKSWRKIVGFHRKSGEEISFGPELLHRKNREAFVNACITAQAAGQRTASQNIANQTGYGMSRIAAAKKWATNNGFHRFRLRVHLATFDKLDDALEARRDLYRGGKCILSDVLESGGQYILSVTVGTVFDFLRDAEATGGPVGVPGKTSKAAYSERMGAQPRETTVFRCCRSFHKKVNAITKLTERYILADFLTIDAGDAFFSRHNWIKNHA